MWFCARSQKLTKCYLGSSAKYSIKLERYPEFSGFATIQQCSSEMGCVPAWLMHVPCAVCVTVTLMTNQVQNLKNNKTTGDKRKETYHFLNFHRVSHGHLLWCHYGQKSRAVQGNGWAVTVVGFMPVHLDFLGLIHSVQPLMTCPTSYSCAYSGIQSWDHILVDNSYMPLIYFLFRTSTEEVYFLLHSETS